VNQGVEHSNDRGFVQSGFLVNRLDAYILMSVDDCEDFERALDGNDGVKGRHSNLLETMAIDYARE
jgi:hypothetical protein